MAAQDGTVVGRVVELARYPVKSTAGETLTSCDVDLRGLAHDREWAAYTDDGGLASGKTTKRFRKVEGLLGWKSAVAVGGRPELRSPDGDTYDTGDPTASRALSEALGRPLELRREAGVPHHDDCGVHLVTTSACRQLAELVGGPFDVRRARANVVLDTEGTGFVEDDWIGGVLGIGEQVRLRLVEAMPRCVMVDLPQAGVRAEDHVLAALGRAHDVLLGLQAEVLRPGSISVGDPARLL
jgi:uncharacterized protein YcbX